MAALPPRRGRRRDAVLSLGMLLGLLGSGGGHMVVMRLTDGDRSELLARLSEAQRRCPRFRVVDVGAALKPWTRNVADAIIDISPDVVQECFPPGDGVAQLSRDCCRIGPDAQMSSGESCFNEEFSYARCCRDGRPKELLRFALDVNTESAWEPVLRRVEEDGKFDFVITSHILEDIPNPVTVLEMLPRVARAGFVAMPSKFTELQRGIDSPTYRGHIHHRWIFTVQQGELVAMPKMPFLETEPGFDGAGDGKGFELIDLSFEWAGEVPYRLLNKGFLGPTPEAVVRMYTEALNSTRDDVDAAVQSPTGTIVYAAGVNGPLPCAEAPDAEKVPPRPAADESAPAPRDAEGEEDEAGAAAAAPGVSGHQLCGLGDFRRLPPGLVSALGSAGERCFRRELDEVRSRCLRSMQAIEAAITIWWTCSAAAESRAAKEAACAHAAGLLPSANASAIYVACVGEPAGPPEAAHARNGRCARAALFARWHAAVAPLDLGGDCQESADLKGAFHADMAERFSRLPWSSLEHETSPWMDREVFIEFGQSMMMWVQYLMELWWFHTHVFLPAFRAAPALGGERVAPLFRLPPWATPHGPRRSSVLAHLVRLLASDPKGDANASGGVAMAEVGVFMGDTSAALLELGLPLSEVHLVDPWRTLDPVFQAVSHENRRDGIEGPAVRAHVERRFSGLAPTYGFDGAADGAESYLGPPLTRGSAWPASRLLGSPAETRSPRVGVHATESAIASSRLAPETLDLVFLDGAHDHDAVLLDIHSWWPKLRGGGILAGHDFSMAHPGVMEAVLAFTSRLPEPRTEIHLDSDFCFWLVKRGP